WEAHAFPTRRSSDLEFEALANTLSDLAARRAILAEMREGAAKLADLDRPLPEIMGDIQGRMIQAAATLGHDGTRTWDEILVANHEQTVLRREGKAEPAWPVGLLELAKHLKGIRRKHLIVVAGRPSMGKTTFAQFWMTFLARRGVHVYVFCPDQDPEEIVERELWNLSGIDGQTWERPHQWTPQQWEAANTAFSKAQGLPIKLNGKRGLSQDEVCAIARKEKASDPDLGVIVIDHLTALRLTGDR